MSPNLHRHVTYAAHNAEVHARHALVYTTHNEIHRRIIKIKRIKQIPIINEEYDVPKKKLGHRPGKNGKRRNVSLLVREHVSTHFPSKQNACSVNSYWISDCFHFFFGRIHSSAQKCHRRMRSNLHIRFVFHYSATNASNLASFRSIYSFIIQGS